MHKTDYKFVPLRSFASIRALEEGDVAPLDVYNELYTTPDLPGHMTRRGVVKSFLVGFTGLTLGCAEPRDPASGDTGLSRHTGTTGDDTGTGGTTGDDTGTGGATGDTDTGGTDDTGTGGTTEPEVPSHDLDAWVNVAEDGVVTVAICKNEMGQGIATAFAMLMADEMDADWDKVRMVLVPQLYDNTLPGWGAGTWGSLSVPYHFEDIRELGAAARSMLVAAAAARLGVSEGSLTVEDGVISHKSKGSLTFGEVAADAAKLSPPPSVSVKDLADLRIVGQDKHRLDIRDHITGQTVYGTDVVVPDMLYAAVRQSPVFGGEVSNLDKLDISGTGALDVVAVPNGVAVVADSWWLANKVLGELPVEFEAPPEMRTVNTPDMTAKFAQDLYTGEGAVGTDIGDAELALAGAVTTIDSEYASQMLAHTSMEPMACTAHVTKDSCEIWIATQYAEGVQGAAASVTGLPDDKILIHTTALGGGFGRKAETDYAIQAVYIAWAVGRPVKLIWSREEDIQHDYYRPPASARVRAGVNAEGRITAWVARAAGCAISNYTSARNLSGFDDLPYDVPNQLIDWVGSDYGIPFGFLRAPGHNKFNFMVECAVDELAVASGQDPAQFRLDHLADNERMYAVLEAALEAASWGKPTVKGAGHGIGIQQVSFGSNATYVALVAEVWVDSARKVHVSKVWAAVDCGVVINPDIVRAQVEGCIIYSLATGVREEITLTDGAVDQSNFHNYGLLKMADSPEIETVIIDSTEDPGGIGEHAVGPLISAVLNGLYQATGERVRELPIAKAGFY